MCTDAYLGDETRKKSKEVIVLETEIMFTFGWRLGMLSFFRVFILKTFFFFLVALGFSCGTQNLLSSWQHVESSFFFPRCGMWDLPPRPETERKAQCIGNTEA